MWIILEVILYLITIKWCWSWISK